MTKTNSLPGLNAESRYPPDIGEFLFTFAIIADSHMEPEETGAATTIPRSNSRNRFIVAELNRLAPKFVIHLGDLVHPVPNMASYEAAAEVTKAVFGRLGCKMHVMPGNHDIGDKPAFWAPAATVKKEWLELFKSKFGPDYYSFDHQGVHFVVVNSPILNSDLPDEAAQRMWLEEELAAHKEKRIFLCTHYPPFLLDPSEDGHYDNIDEPARAWLLTLLQQHKVEAVFSGHVHNFFYNRLGKTDLYTIPACAFVRRDYSEMFRIGPAPEFGRNDADKVGYFIVDVHARGHVARFARTHGALADAARASSPPPVHPKVATGRSIGAHLRHPWSEITEMPFNGPTDEFVRKRVRNDYAVEALWDLGLRYLRVPFSDIANAATCERIGALAGMGHHFTVFTAGVPDQHTVQVLLDNADRVAAWEIVLQMDDIGRALSALAEAKRAGIQTFVARLQSSAGSVVTEAQGANFKHFVSHGFSAEDSQSISRVLGLDKIRIALDGLAFRIDLHADPIADVRRIREIAKANDFAAAATICLSPDAPSGTNCDHTSIASRVAKSVMAGLFGDEVRLFLDTFVDVDRGYCVRHGLLDRRYNRHPAGAVLRHLHSAVSHVHRVQIASTIDGEVEVVTATDKKRVICLLLPRQGASPRVTHLSAQCASVPMGGGAIINLLTGHSGEISWIAESHGLSTRFRFSPAVDLADPTLLTLDVGPSHSTRQENSVPA